MKRHHIKKHTHTLVSFIKRQYRKDWVKMMTIIVVVYLISLSLTSWYLHIPDDSIDALISPFHIAIKNNKPTPSVTPATSLLQTTTASPISEIKSSEDLQQVKRGVDQLQLGKIDQELQILDNIQI